MQAPVFSTIQVSSKSSNSKSIPSPSTTTSSHRAWLISLSITWRSSAIFYALKYQKFNTPLHITQRGNTLLLCKTLWNKNERNVHIHSSHGNGHRSLVYFKQTQVRSCPWERARSHILRAMTKLTQWWLSWYNWTHVSSTKQCVNIACSSYELQCTVYPFNCNGKFPLSQNGIGCNVEKNVIYV